jgi:hypothetical protein
MNKEGLYWKQIEAYVEGRLSSAEAHAFEREMQNDPFLSDAVDGLMQEEGEARKRALSALRQKMNGHAGSGVQVYYRAAAVFILMLGTALVFWLRFQSAEPPAEVAMQKPDAIEQTEASEEHPSADAMNSQRTQPASQPQSASDRLPDAVPLDKKTIVSKDMAEEDYRHQNEAIKGNTAPELAPAAPAAGQSRNFAAGADVLQDAEVAGNYASSPVEDAADMSLLYNPDVVEELLSFAASFTEPELEAKENYQDKVKRKSATSDAGVATKEATLPPPSKTMIIKLIRDGRYDLATQEVQRMQKYYPNTPVVTVLDAAVLIRLNKRDSAIQRMETLRKTKYQKDADRLILRIQQ